MRIKREVVSETLGSCKQHKLTSVVRISQITVSSGVLFRRVFSKSTNYEHGLHSAACHATVHSEIFNFCLQNSGLLLLLQEFLYFISQIKKPTNALYFHKYTLMPLHMFRLYKATIRGSKFTYT